MLINTRAGWGWASRLFHWVAALAVLFLLAHGWWMTEFAPRQARFEQYALHAQWGYALLALMVLRLLWRWVTPVPELPADSRPWERVAAHLSHWGLYLLVFAASLSGWALTGTSRRPLDMMFGLRIPPMITDRSLHGMLEHWHEMFSWTLAALIAVHVAAAFHHLLIRKNSVMRRMLVSVREN